jgi:hypothetical protein
MEAAKSEHERLCKRIDKLQSIEDRHGELIGSVKSDHVKLWERVEQLEPNGHKRIESLEERHSKWIKAVKSESAAVRERIDLRHKIALPPHGDGILGFLKRRNYIVTITVSSTCLGSTQDLLTESVDYWVSRDVPNSWIQWTIGGGIRAVISSVKIIGAVESIWTLPSGVKNFMIEGSNDGASWTNIIDSKTCRTTCGPYVTLGEALPRRQRAFSMIRLTRTGPRYCPKVPTCHKLAISYIDFGGEIIFPMTAKEK